MILLTPADPGIRTSSSIGVYPATNICAPRLDHVNPSTYQQDNVTRSLTRIYAADLRSRPAAVHGSSDFVLRRRLNYVRLCISPWVDWMPPAHRRRLNYVRLCISPWVDWMPPAHRRRFTNKLPSTRPD